MLIIGTGRLTKTPILRDLPQQNTKVCDFVLACSEKRKIKGETVSTASFLNCTIWDSAAEVLCAYAKVGDQILIEAVPRTNNWVDPNSGEKRSKLYFRINNFEFCAKARKNQDIDKEEKVEENEPEEETVDF